MRIITDLCIKFYLNLMGWFIPPPRKKEIMHSKKDPAVLTQALGQGAVPGAVPLTGGRAGAQQVVAWVTSVRHSGLEAVAMWPAGKYLSNAVLYVTWLCAVHNWREGDWTNNILHQHFIFNFFLLHLICLSITFRICYFHPSGTYSSTPI